MVTNHKLRKTFRNHCHARTHSNYQKNFFLKFRFRWVSGIADKMRFAGCIKN